MNNYKFLLADQRQVLFQGPILNPHAFYKGPYSLGIWVKISAAKNQKNTISSIMGQVNLNDK